MPAHPVPKRRSYLSRFALLLSLGLALATTVLPGASQREREGSPRWRLTDVGSETADFNGDQWPDLAMGAPDEDIGKIANAGVVHVLYNTGVPPYLLGTSHRQTWSQDSAGILDRAEASDRFGASLAWGDFNLDGYDDLAIGVPGEDLATKTGSIRDAGAVSVLYGSASGLTARDQLWSQNSSRIRDTAERGDQFGASLGVGHFGMVPGANGNGDALVVGVPREDVGSKKDAGAINVIYGSGTNELSSYGNQYWTQDSSGVPGTAETGDRFGQALVAGEYNSTFGGPDVLAIGTPLEDLGSTVDAGMVTLLFSSGAGLEGSARNWTQDSSEVTDSAEAGDRFGAAVATLNADGSDAHDLAIGVPGEDLAGALDAGAVHVLFGHSGGPSGPDAFLTQQGEETPEAGDRYGSSLGAPMDDALAIGVPGEDLVTDAGTVADAGAVAVHYTPEGYFTPAEVETWTQDSQDILDAAEAGDRFGSQVRVAGGILGIGVALEDLGTRTDTGGVAVLYWIPLEQRFFAANNQFWTEGSSGLGGTRESGDHVGASLSP